MTAWATNQSVVNVTIKFTTPVANNSDEVRRAVSVRNGTLGTFLGPFMGEHASTTFIFEVSYSEKENP